jgi:hypothetical protein
VGTPVRVIELGNTEWTRGYAIAAAVAHIVLNNNGLELGADDGAGWTSLKASSMHAMLADVAEHEPGDAVLRMSLDERHVSPSVGSEIDRVVIAESS